MARQRLDETMALPCMEALLRVLLSRRRRVLEDIMVISERLDGGSGSFMEV